jgi:hypothetical protein
MGGKAHPSQVWYRLLGLEGTECLARKAKKRSLSFAGRSSILAAYLGDKGLARAAKYAVSSPAALASSSPDDSSSSAVSTV